jgi:hypothetical protein
METRISQPVGQFDDKAGEWRLVMPWKAYTSAGIVAIRPGFLSDGASIPRILWTAVGPRYAPRTFPAAVVHDALYAARLTDRATADRVFLEILREMGVNRVKRSAYHFAVRACGGFLWRRAKIERIESERQYAGLFSCPMAADAWLGIPLEVGAS